MEKGHHGSTKWKIDVSQYEKSGKMALGLPKSMSQMETFNLETKLKFGGGGCQHTILPNFPGNCMKWKEFGRHGRGGGLGGGRGGVASLQHPYIRQCYIPDTITMEAFRPA